MNHTTQGKVLMMLTLVAALMAPAHAVEVTWAGATGHASNPQWSPDGNWLAFEVNNNSDKVELFIVKVNNGNPTAPTRLPISGGSSSFSAKGVYVANPNWHPQGTLVFEGANAGGDTRIYFLRPGSSAPSEFLNATQAPGMLSWPTFSPTGQELAFISSASGAGDVYIFNVGANQVRQAFGKTSESENAPRWAPDAKTLAFSRKNYGTEDLFSWAVGGTTTAPVKGGGGNGDQTRARVVGTNLVYFSNERGDDKWDICVVPLAGGERKVIARDVRLPLRSPPSITPDGRAVIYGAASSTQDGAIYVANLDGSGSKTISTGGLTAVGDPSMVTNNGRTYLSFTALPASGADWRQLHVIDVTGQF